MLRNPKISSLGLRVLVVGAGEPDCCLQTAGWAVGGSLNSGCAPSRTHADGTLFRLEEGCADLSIRLHRRLSGAARCLLLGGAREAGLADQLRLCGLEDATFGLAREQPQFSAATVLTQAQKRTFATAAILTAAAVLAWPSVALLALSGFVALGYAANALFRAWLFWVGADERSPEPAPGPADCDLPTYTVLVPLYREANVIPQLTKSLRSLDYPGIM